MSRSCQSATFSRPTTDAGADDPREAADPLGDDRVALVRHRRRALLPAAERLLNLAELGAGEVADLGREPVERRRAQREGRQELGVPVPRDDLRRDRLGREPEALAGDPLDLRVAAAVRPHRAGELADPHAFERPLEALAIALELERPPGELGAEGDRLGMDAVRAARHHGLAVLLGPRHHGGERPVDAVEDQGSRLAHLERRRRVEHVGGRQPVVEPASDRPQVLGDRVDEGREVVLRALLDLGDALGRRRNGALAHLGRGIGGDGADLGPSLERGQLDLEQAREPALLRPDALHVRAGIAGDHRGKSRERAGLPRRRR